MSRKPFNGSTRMRGTPHGQVEGLFHFISGIGMSRHQLKAHKIPDVWIHSDNTRSTYLRVWHSVVGYAQMKYGLNQILAIQPSLMSEWLELQMRRNLAPATVRTYTAALTKFMLALEYYEAWGRRHKDEKNEKL